MVLHLFVTHFCLLYITTIPNVHSRTKQAEEKAVNAFRRMEALSSELESKSGQLAAATEDLEVSFSSLRSSLCSALVGLGLAGLAEFSGV